MEVRKIDFFLTNEKVKKSDIVEDFKKFIEWVDEKQKKAEDIKEKVLKGEDIPLHEMVIEFQKAKVALNLLIEVRNKLLEAFNELMRMQV